MQKTYPHKLSVIIVNYNVEYFLEQCLNSVKIAMKGVSGEVFVVDNRSIDGSVEMVRTKFPEFTLIANQDNLGFSKANNQAARLSTGEYVLLLNPDTVVEEDTFQKVVAFMDAHPDAGGLGVKMVDGKGRFLPESKRGLPTPMVAFWKIFGLSSLFPKSKIFGRYHLGHLDKNETHEIEILSGAFMLMRKEALDKVGLLDEEFFMYGEDIDLSHRITQGGYKNYYFADTSIIHYKGESTKKSSVNYVLVFYKAMVIFARKHFSQKNAKLFSFLIYSAIYLRAFVAILSRFIRTIFLPLFDAAVIFGGMVALTRYWAISDIQFPPYIFSVSLPSYLLLWMVNLYIQGSYDKPHKWVNTFNGIAYGTLLILLIYAILPKEVQFSRLYIFISALWIGVYFILSRLYMHFFFGEKFRLTATKSKNFAIVGDRDETQRVDNLLHQTLDNLGNIFFVSHEPSKYDKAIGHIQQLDEIAFIHGIDEVIFCAKNCSAADIIDWMTKLEGSNVDFKIAQPETLFLIGSNSIDTAGDLYLMRVNKIEDPKSKRTKRLFDFFVSFLFLMASPIIIWVYKNKVQWFKNMFSVLIGKFALVGFYQLEKSKDKNLPKLKYGILSPKDLEKQTSNIGSEKLNLLYARDYDLWKDVKILKKCWTKLDRAMS